MLHETWLGLAEVGAEVVLIQNPMKKSLNRFKAEWEHSLLIYIKKVNDSHGP